MAEDFQLGDIVDVDGFTAIIRFIGETEFSQGIWIGVEYNKESGPRGKNDGAVHGVKYFDCAEKYGMFCKPSKPRLIERGVAPPPQRQSIAGPRGGGTVGRPASVASPGNVASPRPGIQVWMETFWKGPLLDACMWPAVVELKEEFRLLLSLEL